MAQGHQPPRPPASYLRCYLRLYGQSEESRDETALFDDGHGLREPSNLVETTARVGGCLFGKLEGLAKRYPEPPFGEVLGDLQVQKAPE